MRAESGWSLKAAVLVAMALVALICGEAAGVEAAPHAVIVLPFAASDLAPGDQWMGEGVAQSISLGLAQHPAFVRLERCRLAPVDDPGIGSEALARRLAMDGQATAALYGRIGRHEDGLVLEPHLLHLPTGSTTSLPPLTFSAANLLTWAASLPALYADALQVPLSEADRVRFWKAGRPTRSLLAFELFTRGELMLQGGALASAVDLLLRATQTDPDFAGAQYTLGEAHLLLGNRWKAAAQFRAAMVLDSTMPEPYKALGDLFLAAPRALYTQAIEAYSMAIARRPFHADAHVGLGDAKAASGDADGAVAAYQTALTLDPRNPRAHLGLGKTYADRGRFADSVMAYQRAVELNCRRCWPAARAPSPLCVQIGGTPARPASP